MWRTSADRTQLLICIQFVYVVHHLLYFFQNAHIQTEFRKYHVKSNSNLKLNDLVNLTLSLAATTTTTTTKERPWPWQVSLLFLESFSWFPVRISLFLLEKIHLFEYSTGNQMLYQDVVEKTANELDPTIMIISAHLNIKTGHLM